MLNDITPRDSNNSNTLRWAPDAPHGGKVVMNRILKEKATVPLFFAQTLVSALRDVGYNHTSSALCEHVDNALEARADEIRIYFRQTGKKGDYKIDVGVYDNGCGMAPTVLKVATSFGGSMSYNNRQGIGRYGMGMKTAALSMSSVMELYSWQESNAVYHTMLDVEAIGTERANLVEIPDPSLMAKLPVEVSELLTKPMDWPKNRNEQDLLALNNDDLNERLGSSGTIVYMPNCDRLTSAKARTLVDHAVQEMAHVYRRAIAQGLRLYINNRLVEAFDPTYSMISSRHTRCLDDLLAKQSRLISSKLINVQISENSKDTAPVTVKLYKLPIEEWSTLTRKTLKNDLHVFDGLTVSILRNDREVFAGKLPQLTTGHSVTHWYRVQIDFPGVLDEAFGVATNKQGVRMKDYVLKSIKEEIGNDITTINDEIKRFQAAQASTRKAAKPSTSEIQASDADPFQMKPLQEILTLEEQEQIDANLHGLAVSLKRENETEEEAFERVKASKYLIAFRHDDYWPFYHVDHRFGRIILTINTAHPFFTELYNPVREIEIKEAVDDEESGMKVPKENVQQGPIVALELLLLSLARTQSMLSVNNDDARKLLDSFRREWSEAYRIQLTAV